MLDEDHYLRYQEFDRVANLRGRPRGSTAFAAQPTAPQLAAPLDRGSQLVIPATQQPASSQPAARGRGRGRARGSRGGRRSRGASSGLTPSIRREPSQWEGVEFDGDNARDPETASGTSLAGEPSLTPTAGRGSIARGRGRGRGRASQTAGRGGITRQAGTRRSSRQVSSRHLASQLEGESSGEPAS